MRRHISAIIVKMHGVFGRTINNDAESARVDAVAENNVAGRRAGPISNFDGLYIVAFDKIVVGKQPVEGNIGAPINVLAEQRKLLTRIIVLQVDTCGRHGRLLVIESKIMKNDLAKTDFRRRGDIDNSQSCFLE